MDLIPYVLLGIIVVFIAVQVVFRVGAIRLRGKPAPDVHDLIGHRLQPGKKALYYFYSSHCPPCRTMSPRIDRLAERFPNVFKVDVGESRELTKRFSITATPAVIVVDEGQIARAMIGTLSEKRLAAWMQPGGS
ncbi:MAG: thioredoxin family protein [Gammaproteobacteria bacterium]|nr:thioredoxin family protein [Gammaproteobacteria bacterium]